MKKVKKKTKKSCFKCMHCKKMYYGKYTNHYCLLGYEIYENGVCKHFIN